jgi:hypothetical protein
LVPRPRYKNVIDTKWVFENKLNEDGEVIEFEEMFSPVSKMEAIILILEYACSKNIKVYQMDVK